MRYPENFDVIVIGGGHAGAEAAWAAANSGARIAMITMDPTKIGAMSCNPAIGGLAKGQMVREIDALGGLMGLAADATGIQFRMLNSSKGPAVRGPRCQSDKYRYASQVQNFLASRTNLDIIAGIVEEFVVTSGRCVAVKIHRADESAHSSATLRAHAFILTTGTFMRALMHTGTQKTKGGRVGESSAVAISETLRQLGFELGRLKTGTPPRLAAESINFDGLELQPGDDPPVPFSNLTELKNFPVTQQRPCHITYTNSTIHEIIRTNIHRAPMYNGQIETAGPRYCPSIEDKVVRFADRSSHHVFLEPESLDTNEIYCNGISTSLPADVQDNIVRHLPGCENAKILRYGYAVEYDMVWPHQIDTTCMTKRIEGLFLAGQINGTSGYEEAAGQGLIAGINAVNFARGQPLVRLRRNQAYIGVMLDDLVTKTPQEPYRMFTSRAEFRLLLRADNADERLTPLGRQWGVVENPRWAAFTQRQAAKEALRSYINHHHIDSQPMGIWLRRTQVTIDQVRAALGSAPLPPLARNRQVIGTVLADAQYAGYIDRQQRELDHLGAQEGTGIPSDFNFDAVTGLRREASMVLAKFRPATLGQAGRLAGVNPTDLMLVSVALAKE